MMSRERQNSDGLAEDTHVPSGDQPYGRVKAWRMGWGLYGLGLAALTGFFWGTAESAVRTWSTTDSYGHCFLVIPISAYFIWRRRLVLSRIVPRPNFVGVVAAVLMALVWKVGDVSGTLVVQQVAFIGMAQALFLAIMGTQASRAVTFPLLYLYFAVPFGSFLIAPLQELTALVAVQLLQWSGVPVHLNGFWIEVPAGTFHIAEACAGIRFLISSLAIGVLAAHVLFDRWSRRLLFVLLAAAVPVLGNGLRAYGIILIAHLDSLASARQIDHVTFGLVFLALITAILLSIGWAIRETGSAAPAALITTTGPVSSTRTFATGHLTVGTIAIAIIAGIRFFGPQWVSDYSVTRLWDLPEPEVSAPWFQQREFDSNWKPRIIRSDGELLQRYSDGNHLVDVFLAYFTKQRQGAEVVNQQNDLAGGAASSFVSMDRIVVIQGGDRIRMNSARLLSPRGNRIVWYCYWVDEACSTSAIEAKLRQVKASFFGGTSEAAIVAISTPANNGASDAADVLSGFIEHLEPLNHWFERARAGFDDGEPVPSRQTDN